MNQWFISIGIKLGLIAKSTAISGTDKHCSNCDLPVLSGYSLQGFCTAIFPETLIKA